MTFDEVMKQVRAVDTENNNQSLLSTYAKRVIGQDHMVQIPIGDELYQEKLIVTAEQFLAIYKILGE